MLSKTEERKVEKDSPSPLVESNKKDCSIFSKEYRLRKRSDFESLRRCSKKIRVGSWVGYYQLNGTFSKSIARSRLGISVSRKVGNAVKRNKYKRLVREIYRKSTFKFSGYDILIVLIPTNNFEMKLLEQDLKSLFKTIDWRKK